MKSLTATEQKIKSLWIDNSRIEIGQLLSVTPDYVTNVARAIRLKGYELSKKNTRDDDAAAILDSVKRIQKHYNQVGDSEAFKHEMRRIYTALGFTSVREYNNRVRSYMGKAGVDGGFSNYLRGKVPGHRYIGTDPRSLISQRWNGSLSL